jgi:hypothetical protein
MCRTIGMPLSPEQRLQGKIDALENRIEALEEVIGLLLQGREEDSKLRFKEALLEMIEEMA